MNDKKKALFFRWFFVQLRCILKQPGEFFNNNQFQKFSSRSIWFGVVSLCVGLGGQALIEIIFLNWSEGIFQTSPQNFMEFMKILFPQNDNNLLTFLRVLHVLKIQKQVSLVLLPFIAFSSVYLFAGILHLMIRGLRLRPYKNASYENTLQLVGFCQAPMFFSFVPFFAPFASIWCIVLLFRGIKSLYSGGLALKFIVVLLPGFFIRLMWASSLEMIASSLAKDTFNSNIEIKSSVVIIEKKLKSKQNKKPLSV